ncbi:hypothetical protein [Roseateles oligotrophus]|nr:hypothetical protein [Roseateles oligotrophus]
MVFDPGMRFAESLPRTLLGNPIQTGGLFRFDLISQNSLPAI